MKTKTTDPSFTSSLLCADQGSMCVWVWDVSPDASDPVLWRYPPEDDPASDLKPTDAKRVVWEGDVHVLAAYHGRVQLIRFEDKALVKDYSTYRSCHSAEILPDGAIVSACASDDMLRVHHSETDVSDLPFPDAHGVVWDRKRECLWALGERLCRLNYADGRLSIVSELDLPLSPTGHDLFPLQSEDKLLVSNYVGLFLFDPESETFEQISALEHIKSASQHGDGSLWVTEPMQLPDCPTWQSNAVIRLQPESPVQRLTHEPARFYKARWWQEVPFSYGV